MKKILFTTAVLVSFGADVFAQGTILFNASTADHAPINASTDGTTSSLFPVAGLAGFGQLNVAFFAAPNGTALTLNQGLPNFAGWTQAATLATSSSSLGAGSGFAASILMPIGTAGNPVELEVVAWTGSDTTWNQAVADSTDLVAFSGDFFNGLQEGGLGWSQGTGNPSAIPPIPTPVPIGSTTFNGLTLRKVATPEPSTYALGIMGAVVFFAFRRMQKRKAAAAAC
jgi:hypothetical protein